MKKQYVYKHNPIIKNIFWAMLAPTILMNLTTAIGSVADTIIIGHYLNDLSLSVVTFATPIYMIINTFAALFAVGGCIAMSIDSGKGQKHSANQAFSLSIELLTITGVLLLLSGIFFSNTITHWLGASEDVFALVSQYSRIILVGAPIFMLNIGLAFFVRNDGRPTLSMIGMFSAIIVDIILNFIFVGFMHMGVSGAAYSTVIGQFVSIIVIGIHFFSSKNTLKFRFSSGRGALRIIKNGGSSALHFIYQFVTILIINHFLTKLAGTNGIVIYTVIFNLSTVSLSVFEGISQTIQPMVSTYFGEKNYRNIRETLRLAIISVIIICGSVTLLLEFIPQIVPIVFDIEDVLLIEKSIVAVRIFATSMIIMTVNVIIGYYLQSIEQGFTASIIISLRSFVLFLGATFVLARFFGMNGVWAAYTVAEVLTLFIIVVIVRSKQSKLKKNGTLVNLLLLDEAIEKNTACFICDCRYHSFDEFIVSVDNTLKENPFFCTGLREDVLSYLTIMKPCCVAKKGNYVGIELNQIDKKIIIRDNMNHSEISESLKDVIKNNHADYGPVLGWNRICIE